MNMNALRRQSLPLAILAAGLFLTPQLLRAQPQEQSDPRRTVIVAATATATVKAVDPTNRTVTLEKPDGDTTVVRCGPNVVNFDQIAVGDRVRATTLGQMVVGVAKPGTVPDSTERQIIRAPKGAQPGVLITETTSETAKIDAIDQQARTLTVRGDSGKAVTHKVAPDVNLTGIKAGDDVVVQFTRGLALMVEKPDAEAQLTAGTDKPARGAAAMEATTATATVEAVDPQTRFVTLKKSDGETHMVHLGKECINFDQIKVGDRVTATLADEQVVGIGKAGSMPAASDGEAKVIARAPAGSKPRVLVTDVDEMNARIDAIDAANRTVTLTPAGGTSRTIKVGPSIKLDALKAGDEVAVRCTRALAIVVEKP